MLKKLLPVSVHTVTGYLESKMIPPVTILKFPLCNFGTFKCNLISSDVE